MIVVMVGMAAVIFLVDIVIKQTVEERMNMTEEREILNDKVILRRVHNKGFILNAFDKYPHVVKYVSAALGGIVVVYDIILLCRRGHFIEKVGMMFLTGGALSNLFDRIVRGKVVDYIGFKTRWKAFTRITFNIGDFFIMGGAFLAAFGRSLKK